MKTLLTSLLATAFILSSGAAFAEDSAKPDEGKRPPHNRFAETDADKDGFLTKDEMQKEQAKRMDEMFTRTDSNKDGKLSKDEMEKARAEMHKKWKERREANKDGKGGPEGGPKDGPPPEGGPKE